MKTIIDAIQHATTDYIPYKQDNWMWLIDPNTKKWVVSVAESGYTFYCYDFFSNLFKYLSLNCLEEEKHIKSWTKERLNVYISEHFYPDYLPHDYDWRNQFDVQEVLDKGEPVVFI